MLRFVCLLAISFAGAMSVSAQYGSDNVYSFLNLPSSARTTALGMNLISVMDEDVSLAMHNPASLNNLTSGALSFNHNFHLTDIQNGYFAYGWKLKKAKINFHSAIQYTDYGDFTLADELGNKSGQFSAGDYAFITGASKELNERFRVGVNAKFVYSRLESYNSTGLAFDLGAMYSFPDKNARIGLVARNIGFQTSSYNGNRESFPIDLQVAYSKQLEHLPFRYSITAHHMHVWDLTYNEPDFNENPFDVDTSPGAIGQFSDKLFRHFILSGEFLLGKSENLKLRFGYNHMLKKELTVNPFRSFAGFSGGFEFKIKQFSISYGFGIQHLAGSVKHISLRTDLDWFKRQNP